MMWGFHPAGAWLWLGIAVLAGCAIVIAVALAGLSGPGRARPGQAARELDERFARGGIDESQYRQRRAALPTSSPGRRAGRWRPGVLVIALAAIVGLGAVSLAAAATTTRASSGRSLAAPSCTAPSLPGHVVNVRLWDMGRMMGSGTYPGGMMGGYYPGGRASTTGGWMQMMRITADRSMVAAGTVSFRVWNTGSLTHELVILPLPPAGAGTRPVGADGTVSERGSLGEASAACAAGTGHGITPGTTGWVTLHLAPGRYALICNLPGHYARGMFTELDVG